MKRILFIFLFIFTLSGCSLFDDDPVILDIYLADDLISSSLTYDVSIFESMKSSDYYVVVSLMNTDDIDSILSLEVNGNIFNVGTVILNNYYLYDESSSSSEKVITVSEDNSKIYIPLTTPDIATLITIDIDNIVYSSNSKFKTINNEDLNKTQLSIFTVNDEPIFIDLEGPCGFLSYDQENGVIEIPEILNFDQATILGVMIDGDENLYEINDSNLVFINGSLFNDFVKVRIVYDNGVSAVVGNNEYYSRIIINTYEELISLPRDIGKTIFIKSNITIPDDNSFKPFIANINNPLMNLYGEYGYFVTITNESSESLVLIDLISNPLSSLRVQGLDFNGNFTFKSGEIDFVDSNITGNLTLEANSNDNIDILEVVVDGVLAIN